MKPPVASESNEGRTGKDGIIFFYHPNPTTRLIELFPKDFHIQIKSLGSSVFSCTPRFSKSSFEANAVQVFHIKLGFMKSGTSTSSGSKPVADFPSSAYSSSSEEIFNC